MKKSIRFKLFGLRGFVQYSVCQYLVQVCDNDQGYPLEGDGSYDARMFEGSRRQCLKDIRAWIVQRSADRDESQIASVYEVRGSESEWLGDMHVRVCRSFVVSFDRS